MKDKIYYLDDNHNFVSRKKATIIYIRQFDDNGNLINEYFMDKHVYENKDNDLNLKDDEINFLRELNPNYDVKRLLKK